MTESNEKNIIQTLFKEHLRSIGVVSIAIRVRGKQRYFWIAFALIALFLVLWAGYQMIS
jgi:hypothetical protein